MPSPGRIVILFFIFSLVGQFVLFNFVFQVQQIVDIIVAIHQAGLFVGVDVKTLGASVFENNLLLLEVNGDYRGCVLFDRVKNLFQELVRNLNRKQRIVQRVVLENVGEEAGNDHAKTGIGDRPGCVLPAASTSEVFSRDKNLARVLGIVHDEIRLGVAVAVIPP